MLILGGVGRIYGAFVGPSSIFIAQDCSRSQFPEYWYLGSARCWCSWSCSPAEHPRHPRRADRQAAEEGVSAALETRALCKSFGALTVAEKIDFRLEPGARHALIGPNGAGKTTFVNI